MDASLDEMGQALSRRGGAFRTEALKAAIKTLRPLINQTSFLDEFSTAGANPDLSMWQGAGLDLALKHVLRQLEATGGLMGERFVPISARSVT